MATTAPVKICKVCRKDVSGVKRVKDPAGNYYCEPCQKAGAQKAGDSSVGSGAAKKEDVRAGVVVLPAFCPNCDTPVMGTRKICVKCHRDVTQMDAIIKRKAAAGKVDGVEVTATWIARVARVVMWVVIAAIVGFVLWGVYLQFVPVVPFDEYPASRVVLIQQWLGAIAQGTDKGYEKAYELTSFRDRIAGNDRSEDRYMQLYKRVHDDFVKKYGDDWLNKVSVENANPADTGETTRFYVAIAGDEHPIDVQVQITVEQGVLNMTLRRDKPSYPENGKWRFGVMGLTEYPIHPTAMTGMEERFGRGKPDFPIVPGRP